MDFLKRIEKLIAKDDFHRTSKEVRHTFHRNYPYCPSVYLRSFSSRQFLQIDALTEKILDKVSKVFKEKEKEILTD